MRQVAYGGQCAVGGISCVVWQMADSIWWPKS